MKRFLSYTFSALLVLCFSLNSQVAHAKTYKMVGVAKSELSSEKEIKHTVLIEVPPQKIHGANSCVEKPVMLKAKIESVTPAARGKRNGKATIKVLAYKPASSADYIDVSDKNFQFNVKEYSEIDFKGLGVSAATSTVSHVLGVPFLSQGVAAVKGAVKPAEGETRLTSAGKSVYQSTPFSYIEKGKELNLRDGDKLTLSFKVDDADGGTTADDEPETSAADKVQQETEFTKNQLSE